MKKLIDETVEEIMDWHYRTVDINFGVKAYAQDATDVIAIVECAIDKVRAEERVNAKEVILKHSAKIRKEVLAKIMEEMK